MINRSKITFESTQSHVESGKVGKLVKFVLKKLFLETEKDKSRKLQKIVHNLTEKLPLFKVAQKDQKFSLFDGQLRCFRSKRVDVLPLLFVAHSHVDALMKNEN